LLAARIGPRTAPTGWVSSGAGVGGDVRPGDVRRADSGLAANRAARTSRNYLGLPGCWTADLDRRMLRKRSGRPAACGRPPHGAGLGAGARRNADPGPTHRRADPNCAASYTPCGCLAHKSGASHASAIRTAAGDRGPVRPRPASTPPPPRRSLRPPPQLPRHLRTSTNERPRPFWSAHAGLGRRGARGACGGRRRAAWGSTRCGIRLARAIVVELAFDRRVDDEQDPSTVGGPRSIVPTTRNLCRPFARDRCAPPTPPGIPPECRANALMTMALHDLQGHERRYRMPNAVGSRSRGRSRSRRLADQPVESAWTVARATLSRRELLSPRCAVRPEQVISGRQAVNGPSQPRGGWAGILTPVSVVRKVLYRLLSCS